MKKYLVNFCDKNIKEKEFVTETNSTVVLIDSYGDKFTDDKESDYHVYCDTYEQAREILIEKINKRIIERNREILSLKDILKTLK